MRRYVCSVRNAIPIHSSRMMVNGKRSSHVQGKLQSAFVVVLDSTKFDFPPVYVAEREKLSNQSKEIHPLMLIAKSCFV
jgi:hypothetical protein